jgi:nitrogen fixation protein NifU and related proteins
MSLRDLYQEMILDHAKNPRCFGKVASATCSCDAHNPVCGDELNLSIKFDKKIDELKFTGKGCAISVASASMLCQQLTGLDVAQAQSKTKQFLKMLTCADSDTAGMGKLEVFAGVRAFPLRVKCATLAWHAALSLLEKENSVTTTE